MNCWGCKRMGKWYDAAQNVRNAMDAAGAMLTDEQAAKVPVLFPTWATNTAYKVGERCTYEGTLYKCLQAHTSQDDWTPKAAVSLWAVVLIPDPNVIPDWVQPDSTNAYMKGDKVRYNGKIYQSLIDNNVWPPDAYPQGWEIVN